MFPNALASGTDIVCVELEDGIAPKDKGAARKSEEPSNPIFSLEREGKKLTN